LPTTQLDRSTGRGGWGRVRSSRSILFPQYLLRKTTKTTNVSLGSQFCDRDSKLKRVRMVIDGLTWGSTFRVPLFLSVPGSDWCSVSIRGRSWYCDQYYRLKIVLVMTLFEFFPCLTLVLSCDAGELRIWNSSPHVCNQ